MTARHPLDLSHPIDGRDHVLGNSDARITVVEYGDFECPTCVQAAPSVRLLLERFEGKVLFAYRHFPLESIHPHALRAAEAAECAAAQGHFWAMHDLLFANQAHLELTDLITYAKRLDLDGTRFAAEMDGEVHLQRIREQIDSGRNSHLRATPGFFVNGVIVDVSFRLHSLFDAVEATL